MKIYKVTWVDAHSITEWTSIEDLEEPKFVQTVGFLVKETERSYYIAGSFAGETEEVGDTIVIPKTWIKEMYELKDAPKKKTSRRIKTSEL